MHLHEGEVTVVSHPGRGSVFTVWLSADLEPQEKTVCEEAVEEESEVSAEIQGSMDGRKKLLIVEDNKEFRSFLKEQFEERYEVKEAADGEEGKK